MKKLLLALMGGVFICVSCVATVGPRGAGVSIAPPLPVIVELVEPYYVHGGYHYYYHSDRWYYSRSRGGPWVDLPRDRYPKEVRHNLKSHDRRKGWKHGRDRD